MMISTQDFLGFPILSNKQISDASTNAEMNLMIVTVSTLIRKADRGSFLRASAAVMQQSKATFLPIPSMA